ncbi:MAG: hypothetical protein J6I46_04410 [Ruminococcus sp.]|nr:hypothetical protein [Ruminococcus sp.]
MTLLGVKADSGWLYSEWEMTYRVGWVQILKSAAALYELAFEDPEVLCNNVPVDIKCKDDILKLEEDMGITVRGMSKNIGVPVMIHLFNQTCIARAVVAMAKDEFKTADYESFNKSMSQFMDSIELVMYM